MTSAVVCLVGTAIGNRPVAEFVTAADVRLERVETVAALQTRLGEGAVDCVVVEPTADGVAAGAVREAVRATDDRLPCLVCADDWSPDAEDEATTVLAPEELSESPDLLWRTAVCAARWYRWQRGCEGAIPESVVEFKQRVIDEAPIGITVTDPTLPDNPIVYANEQFSRLTGYPILESLGRNHRFLQGPDTDPAAVETLASAVEDHRSVSVELVNYRDSGEPFWSRVQIAPLTRDGELSYYVGFQIDVTERKEAQRRAQRHAEELRAERRSLQRVLSRIDGLFQAVTSTAMAADTATELKREICNRIVETSEYTAAWIGQTELTNDRIIAEAQAGCGDTDPAAIDLDTAESEPVARAVRATERVVEHGGQLQRGSPHRRLTGHDGGVGVVPLTYRETGYGVLVVYAEHANTFDEHELAVLDSLGTVIATGLNAVENRRLLTAEECLELQFETVERSLPVVGLSEELETRVEYRSASPHDGAGNRLTMLVDHDDPELVREAVERTLDDVRPALLTSYDDRCYLEIESDATMLSQLLAEHNAELDSFVATDGQGTISVQLPSGADPRPLVERLRSTYPDTELRAQRTRERQSDDWLSFGDSVVEDLTDRQYDVLRKAYLSGYFERPRPVSGDELADSLDISRATFHQHLRVAQRKLVDSVFERQQLSVDPQE
jgi:PAS domain S-box-containing protein